MSKEHLEQLRPLFAGLCLVAVSRLCYKFALPKPLPNIPHDPVTNILGHVLDLARFSRGGEKDGAKWFDSMTAKHGPLCQVLIGHTRLVIIADMAEVERLLLRGKSTDQSRWVRESFGTVIPTGQLALPTNDMWRRHRQLMGPSMSRRYLERMSVRISAGANSLVRLWIRKVELVGSKTFSAEQDLKLAVMDVMPSGDLPSSVDIACASLPTTLPPCYADREVVEIPQVAPPELQNSIGNLMQSVEKLNSMLLPACISRFFVQTLSASWRESWRIVTSYIDSKIIEARGREIQPSECKQGKELVTDANCVVEMIAQREAREGLEKFDAGELRDELVTFMVAGQDTTGVVLSWLVKFLPQDMEIQQKLHDEICTVYGSVSDDEPLDFDILTSAEKLPILEAVVAESLRCARTVPNTMRELIEDEVILGRHVPKGTMLMFPVGTLSAQVSDWGSDASFWRPNRWLKADGSFDANAGPSFPFGIGQRACPGQRLAMLELRIFVAALSRSFVFKPVAKPVAGHEAFIKISRQPEHCYVSLERRPTT
ncbi:cytochrome P450 family protein [Ceratobasidium sp. AG-Ba]|nr:cytochrome P450 family protein [Ceratobasidium sp. AG-Ba]